jgi:hypothetical protein
MVSAHTAHSMRQHKLVSRRFALDKDSFVYTYKPPFKGIFHADHMPATVGMFGALIVFALLSLQMALTPFVALEQQSIAYQEQTEAYLASMNVEPSEQYLAEVVQQPMVGDIQPAVLGASTSRPTFGFFDSIKASVGDLFSWLPWVKKAQLEAYPVDSCGGCQANATCQSGGPMGFQCVCNSGYKSDGAGSCILKTACDNLTCPANSHCILGGPGGAACVCNSGYKSDGAGSCILKTACDNLTCPANSHCILGGPGGAACVCNEGFTKNASEQCVSSGGTGTKCTFNGQNYNPGEYRGQCTGQCGGCASDAGEREVWQCQSNGTWGSSHGECSTECAGVCSGGGGTGTCGDGTCNNGETCSTCAADCGACAGGGTGGGTGGSSTCQNVSYTLNSAAADKVATNKFYANKNLTLDISRAAASNCSGNWDNVSVKVDGVDKGVALCYTNGQSCDLGYHISFSSGAVGTHTVQFTVNYGSCTCNTMTFETVAETTACGAACTYNEVRQDAINTYCNAQVTAGNRTACPSGQTWAASMACNGGMKDGTCQFVNSGATCTGPTCACTCVSANSCTVGTPTNPTPARSTTINGNQVTFAWGAADNASRYVLEVRKKGDTNFSACHIDPAPNNTNYCCAAADRATGTSTGKCETKLSSTSSQLIAYDDHIIPGNTLNKTLNLASGTYQWAIRAANDMGDTDPATVCFSPIGSSLWEFTVTTPTNPVCQQNNMEVSIAGKDTLVWSDPQQKIVATATLTSEAGLKSASLTCHGCANANCDKNVANDTKWIEVGSPMQVGGLKSATIGFQEILPAECWQLHQKSGTTIAVSAIDVNNVNSVGTNYNNNCHAALKNVCNRCSKQYDKMRTQWEAENCNIDPTSTVVVTRTYDATCTAPTETKKANTCQQCISAEAGKYGWWDNTACPVTGNPTASPTYKADALTACAPSIPAITTVSPASTEAYMNRSVKLTVPGATSATTWQVVVEDGTAKTFKTMLCNAYKDTSIKSALGIADTDIAAAGCNNTSDTKVALLPKVITGGWQSNGYTLAFKDAILRYFNKNTFTFPTQQFNFYIANTGSLAQYSSNKQVYLYKGVHELDQTGDGHLNQTDLTSYVSNYAKYQKTADTTKDYTNDSRVNVFDYRVLKLVVEDLNK